MSNKQDLGLSFLDVLSCSLGGLIVLFTVFSAMQRVGSEQGTPSASVSPAPDNPRNGGGSTSAHAVYRVNFFGPRPCPLEDEANSSNGGNVVVVFSDWRSSENAPTDPIHWHVLIVVPPGAGGVDATLNLGIECSQQPTSPLRIEGVWGPDGLPCEGSWSKGKNPVFTISEREGISLKSLRFDAPRQAGG